MDQPQESSILWEASLPVEGLGGVVTPMTYSVLRRWMATLLEAWRGMLTGERGSAQALVPADSVLGYLRGRVFLNQQAADAWISACAVDSQEQTLFRTALGGPLAEAATSLEGRGKTGSASLNERIARMDRMLWRLRGVEKRASAAVAVWEASLAAPPADASPEQLVQALLKEDQAFRNRVSVLAEVSVALAMLTGEVQRALDTPAIVNPAAAARRLMASNARTWEIDMLQGVLDLARGLAAAPALKQALFEEESRLVQALFSHREVGHQLDQWLEAHAWMADDPVRLDAQRWQANPALILRRIAPWCDQAAGITLQAPALGVTDQVLSRVPSWTRRQFLRWARHRARKLQPVSHLLMQQVLRSAGRMHRLLSRLGTDLARKGILADPSDVHSLTFEECVGWVYGSSPSSWLRETASYRKAEASLNAGSGAGITLLETHLPVNAGNPLRGTMTSPRDSGRADGWSMGAAIRVNGTLRLLAPGDEVIASPGEILIGERGTAAWALAVPAAAGVALELDRASGSVVQFCRWLGKPVVIRASGASTAFQSGEAVELDGGNGTIRRPPPVASA